jgi:hypothetical protein
MKVPEDRNSLVSDIIEELLDSGIWEPIDTWGNGQVTLTDVQSGEAAEKIVDMFEQVWNTAYTVGRRDGGNPMRGTRPNPYKKGSYLWKLNKESK